ncbi:MAG: YqzL family protein [Clostridia bacterium]|nr:YqzL family protein [Clostridia bacterium]
MKKDNDAAELAWKMFEKTGSVSYYMLYHDIMRRK